MDSQQQRIEKMKSEILQSLNSNSNSVFPTGMNRNSNPNISVLDISVGDLVNLIGTSSSSSSSLPGTGKYYPPPPTTTTTTTTNGGAGGSTDQTNSDSLKNNSSSFPMVSNPYGMQGRYVWMYPSDTSIVYGENGASSSAAMVGGTTTSTNTSTSIPPVPPIRTFRNILSETPKVLDNLPSGNTNNIFSPTVTNLNLSNVSTSSTILPPQPVMGISSLPSGSSSSSQLPTSAAMAVERAMRSHATMSVNADVNKLKADVSTALLQLDEQKQTFLSVVGDLEVQLASVQRERAEAMSTAETERQRAERAIQVSSRMQATVEAMTQSLSQARDAHTTLQNQQESLLRTLGICQTERDNAKRETMTVLNKIEDYKKALEQAKGREALAVATEGSLKQQLGSIAKDVQLSKQEGITLLADEKARHQLEVDNLKRELDNNRADISRLQNKVTSQHQSLEQLSALWEKTLYELQTSRDNEASIRKELDETKRITEGERVACAIARDECVVLRDTIETLKQEILGMRKQFSIHVQAASDRMLATKAVQNVLQNSSLNSSIAYMENIPSNNSAFLSSTAILSPPHKPNESNMVSPTSYSTINYSNRPNGNSNFLPSNNPSRLSETSQADLQRAIASNTVLEQAWNVLNTTKIGNNISEGNTYGNDVVFTSTRHSPPQNPAVSGTTGISRPVRPRPQSFNDSNGSNTNVNNSKQLPPTTSSVSLNLPDLDGESNDSLPWNATGKALVYNQQHSTSNNYAIGDNSWITIRPNSVTPAMNPLQGSLAGIAASSAASAKVANVSTIVPSQSSISPSSLNSLQNRAKYRIDHSAFPESPEHKRSASRVNVEPGTNLSSDEKKSIDVSKSSKSTSQPISTVLPPGVDTSISSVPLQKQTSNTVKEDEIVNPFLVTLAQAEPLAEAIISGARTAWWTLTAEDGSSFDELSPSNTVGTFPMNSNSGSSAIGNIQRINVDFGTDSNNNTVVTSSVSANATVTNISGSSHASNSGHVTPQLLNYLNQLTPPSSTTPINGNSSK